MSTIAISLCVASLLPFCSPLCSLSLPLALLLLTCCTEGEKDEEVSRAAAVDRSTRSDRENGTAKSEHTRGGKQDEQEQTAHETAGESWTECTSLVLYTTSVRQGEQRGRTR